MPYKKNSHIIEYFIIENSCICSMDQFWQTKPFFWEIVYP